MCLVYSSFEECQWSRKQAELFTAQQANLLQINEKKAMPPRQLQKTIIQIMNDIPEYPDIVSKILKTRSNLLILSFILMVHLIFKYIPIFFSIFSASSTAFGQKSSVVLRTLFIITLIAQYSILLEIILVPTGTKISATLH